MRLHLLAASMIVLCGCADQVAKAPSGDVAHAAVGDAEAAQRRALEDFKDCATRPTSYEQFVCLGELDRASRSSAN
jgi:hypothetical protein